MDVVEWQPDPKWAGAACRHEWALYLIKDGMRRVRRCDKCGEEHDASAAAGAGMERKGYGRQ
jgi:hypothetical protein